MSQVFTDRFFIFYKHLLLLFNYHSCERSCLFPDVIFQWKSLKGKGEEALPLRNLPIFLLFTVILLKRGSEARKKKSTQNYFFIKVDVLVSVQVLAKQHSNISNSSEWKVSARSSFLPFCGSLPVLPARPPRGHFSTSHCWTVWVIWPPTPPHHREQTRPSYRTEADALLCTDAGREKKMWICLFDQL